MARSDSTGKLAERLEHKRNRFVALVRRQPGVSRQDCAHALRMSTFTASRLASELIQQRVIVEAEETEQPRPVGRPSRPLHVRGDYGLFAGVEMEASEWRFVIVDFAGKVVRSEGIPFIRCDTREAYIEQLTRLLREQIAAHQGLWRRVQALGVGAPGLLDHESGRVLDYNLLPGFRDIPMLALCRSVSDKPVHLMDNIRALAMRHLLMHPESDGRTILNVAVRSGIACVLCQNGRIFEGSHWQAGELGAFPVPMHGGGRPHGPV